MIDATLAAYHPTGKHGYELRASYVNAQGETVRTKTFLQWQVRRLMNNVHNTDDLRDWLAAMNDFEQRAYPRNTKTVAD